MELADLKVKMDVVMVSRKYIQDNMNSVNGGFIDRVNHMFFSNDMVEKLAGKKVRIQEIDAEDPILNCLINGFWCSNTWIEKIYVAPERPKIERVKPTGPVTVPKKAADGSTFGTVFKKLLKKYPELGILSTNRLTNLTTDEIQQICDLMDIEFDDTNIRETCVKIFNAVIEHA